MGGHGSGRKSIKASCIYALLDVQINLQKLLHEHVDSREFTREELKKPIHDSIQFLKTVQEDIERMGCFILLVGLSLLLFTSACHADSFSVDLDVIKQIESSGNTMAVSAVGCKGHHQISSITLKEWNNFHPADQHSEADLFIPSVNRKIADWYINKRIPQMLRHYGKEVNLVNVLHAYNCGIGHVVKGTQLAARDRYVAKYERYLK
jgi:hypothetical protein